MADGINIRRKFLLRMPSTDQMPPLQTWREKLAGIGEKLSELRGKVGSLVDQVMPESLGECKPVEYIRKFERRRASSAPQLATLWELGIQGPLLDLTPELEMKGLEHGVFTAEFSLSRLPPGDITVVVQSYTLYLITKGADALPLPRALIQLPIYLDADTLQLELKTGGEGADRLQVSAFMKGVLTTQRRSSPAALSVVSSGPEGGRGGSRRISASRPRELRFQIPRSVLVSGPSRQVRSNST